MRIVFIQSLLIILSILGSDIVSSHVPPNRGHNNCLLLLKMVYFYVNPNYMTDQLHDLEAAIDLLVIAGDLQEIFMCILTWKRSQGFRETTSISAQLYRSVI